MTETQPPDPTTSERLLRDPDRVAFLIPGRGYSAERPLLHYAQAVFTRHGWTTQPIRWSEPPPPRDGQDLHLWLGRLRSFVLQHVEGLIEAEPAPKIALVGKSMGAFAAALAADRDLPAVWLTPVISEPSTLRTDLARSTAPFLLVGGTADPSWDTNVARSLGQPIYEAAGANHGMEIDDDLVSSIEILHHVTTAMDDFVARL